MVVEDLEVAVGGVLAVVAAVAVVEDSAVGEGDSAGLVVAAAVILAVMMTMPATTVEILLCYNNRIYLERTKNTRFVDEIFDSFVLYE